MSSRQLVRVLGSCKKLILNAFEIIAIQSYIILCGETIRCLWYIQILFTPSKIVIEKCLYRISAARTECSLTLRRAPSILKGITGLITSFRTI